MEPTPGDTRAIWRRRVKKKGEDVAQSDFVEQNKKKKTNEKNIGDSVLLCIPDWPGTSYVEQASLRSHRGPPASAL